MAKALRVSVAAYIAPGTASFNLRRNVAQAGELLQLAAAAGADLVVLPELFALQDCDDWPDWAEPLDGYVLTQLTLVARRQGIGIAAGHALRLKDGIYNSLVVLDRDGQLCALYHKTYPTLWELERGIGPGPGAQVCATPFGRLGGAICYDLNFAELRLAYRNQNPDLLLFISSFQGGLQSRLWAFETRSYLISSVLEGHSEIINPVGRVVAVTNSLTQTLTHTINLNCEVVHFDYANENLRAALLHHGDALQFEWSQLEGVMLVTATGDMPLTHTLHSLGWEPAEAYLARARDARRMALPVVKRCP